MSRAHGFSTQGVWVDPFQVPLRVVTPCFHFPRTLTLYAVMELKPEISRASFWFVSPLPSTSGRSVLLLQSFHPLLPQSYRQLGQGTNGHRDRQHFQSPAPQALRGSQPPFPPKPTRVSASALSPSVALKGTEHWAKGSLLILEDLWPVRFFIVK